MAGSRILIVKDDHNLFATPKYNLLEEGYQVDTAVEGAQALKIARSEKTELIILDVMLPKSSGFEVCRILQKGDLLCHRQDGRDWSFKVLIRLFEVSTLCCLKYYMVACSSKQLLLQAILPQQGSF